MWLRLMAYPVDGAQSSSSALRLLGRAITRAGRGEKIPVGLRRFLDEVGGGAGVFKEPKGQRIFERLGSQVTAVLSRRGMMIRGGNRFGRINRPAGAETTEAGLSTRFKALQVRRSANGKDSE